MQVPPDRKLYKYMAAETAKKILEKSSLRWASPILFNDPVDVQFDLRVEYDRERVIDQALQNIVDLYMGRRHMPRHANELAQRIRWLQQNAPGLKDADLKAKFRQSMNEGMDNAAKNMPKNHDEIRALLSKLKLLCFSEVYDNILMWAHYRTALAVPMLHDGAAIGAILVGRDRVAPFSDRHIELLQTFAEQAVIAIENVRLFEETQARTREPERIASTADSDRRRSEGYQPLNLRSADRT